MDDDIAVLRRMYDRFNAKDVDGVLVSVTDDVVWANAMEGGHVHGREAVRAYWTRQQALVSAHVQPLRFRRAEEDVVVAEVLQTISGVEGKPTGEQTHGLHDRTVEHVFRFRDGKVARFDVRDAT